MATFAFYVSRVKSSETKGVQIVCGEYLKEDGIKQGVVMHLKHEFMKGGFIFGLLKLGNKVYSSWDRAEGMDLVNLQFNFTTVQLDALRKQLEEEGTASPLYNPPIKTEAGKEGCSDLQGYQIQITVPDNLDVMHEVEESVYGKGRNIKTSKAHTLKFNPSEIQSVSLVKSGEEAWIANGNRVSLGLFMETAYAGKAISQAPTTQEEMLAYLKGKATNPKVRKQASARRAAAFTAGSTTEVKDI